MTNLSTDTNPFKLPTRKAIERTERRMSARQLTQATRAAKMIRTHLRANGVECTTRIKNFSMSYCVDVELVDQPHAIAEMVRQYCADFREGHFDHIGRYDSDNRRTDIPQTKFLRIFNDISVTMRERIYQWLRCNWRGGDRLPETYETGCDHMRLDGDWVWERIDQVFVQADSPFWRSQRQAKAA